MQTSLLKLGAAFAVTFRDTIGTQVAPSSTTSCRKPVKIFQKRTLCDSCSSKSVPLTIKSCFDQSFLTVPLWT